MSDCRFGKGKRAISSFNLPIDNHPITKFSVYPQAVPDRKKTTIIHPMTNAAAMSMRILAFLERDMRNLELTIVDCEIVRSQLGTPINTKTLTIVHLPHPVVITGRTTL
jgi:hypothetical protein